MGYRHDTQHLSGQQRAIIEKRDTENKRLLEDNKQKNEELAKIKHEKETLEKVEKNKVSIGENVEIGENVSIGKSEDNNTND